MPVGASLAIHCRSWCASTTTLPVRRPNVPNRRSRTRTCWASSRTPRRVARSCCRFWPRPRWLRSTTTSTARRTSSLPGLPLHRGQLRWCGRISGGSEVLQEPERGCHHRGFARGPRVSALGAGHCGPNRWQGRGLRVRPVHSRGPGTVCCADSCSSRACWPRATPKLIGIRLGKALHSIGYNQPIIYNAGVWDPAIIQANFGTSTNSYLEEFYELNSPGWQMFCPT